MEVIALRATALMPILLLQKTNYNSKDKENQNHLERRMDLWKKGEILALYDEGKALLAHARKLSRHSKSDKNSLSCTFSNMMFQGKIEDAIQLLSNKGRGKVLNLSDSNEEGTSFKQILLNKHPKCAAADPGSIIQEQSEVANHPVIFDNIDAGLIRGVSLKTKGAAGPSGLNAYTWKCMCTSFKVALDNLCHALAQTARRVGTQYDKIA